MSSQLRKITDLKKQEKATVLGFSDDEIAGRLVTMGLLPGTEVEYVRIAPFGRAHYIKADGIRLALRHEEANSLLLKI